jgi:hypothetical protein
VTEVRFGILATIGELPNIPQVRLTRLGWNGQRMSRPLRLSFRGPKTNRQKSESCSQVHASKILQHHDTATMARRDINREDSSRP